MKSTTKLKIVGLTTLVIALLLVVLSFTIFRDKSWDHFTVKPNFVLLILGVFLGMVALMITLLGFSPEIAKFSSKIGAETIAHAQKEMETVVSKKAEVVIPNVTPELKRSLEELKKDYQSQLIEIDDLLKKGLITAEEYQEMRKTILGLNK